MRSASVASGAQEQCGRDRYAPDIFAGWQRYVNQLEVRNVGLLGRRTLIRYCAIWCQCLRKDGIDRFSKGNLVGSGSSVIALPLTVRSSLGFCADVAYLEAVCRDAWLHAPPECYLEFGTSAPTHASNDYNPPQ